MQEAPDRGLAAGWQAIERDDLRGAEEIARRALSVAPTDVEFLYLLGSSLLFQNRFQEALSPLTQVAERSPRRAAWHRLGYCRLALGDLKGAEEALRREIAEHPDIIDAYNALGVALVQQSRLEEALPIFQEAARRAPGSAAANNNVANVLGDLGRHEEALPYLRKVIEADPNHAEAHHNLGMLYQTLKRHEEAAASLQEARRLAPGMTYTLSYLVWNKLAACHWQGLAADIEALRNQVRVERAPVDPFTLLAVSPSPEEQRLCAERHASEKLALRSVPLWQGPRSKHDRIRLAYLSADFCEHATAQLAARLFELHDRTRFEVIGVSYGPDDGSPMRRRLEKAFDRFLDVRAMGDEQAALALRQMEVDIAVDLKGYTTGARPRILAYRPAPIQVSYLGFPGTMGTPCIDYLIADRFVVPETAARWYAEQVVCLPDSYQINDDQRPIAASAPTRSQAGLPENGFVFCCFNNSYKILPAIFEIWMRLLQTVGDAVLWLLEDNAAAKRNLQAAARAAGVDADRLVFAPRVPPAIHLARHQLADLFLDTLPCNAHTTASDALWSGLPVLTCSGDTFASRVAGSLLHAVGLPELIAPDLAAYETLSRELAADRSRLAQLRARLQRNRKSSALFHTDRTRRALETAYLRMWEKRQRGEAPSGFSVRADEFGQGR